jgi:hypothetical protein
VSCLLVFLAPSAPSSVVASQVLAYPAVYLVKFRSRLLPLLLRPPSLPHPLLKASRYLRSQLSQIQASSLAPPILPVASSAVLPPPASTAFLSSTVLPSSAPPSHKHHVTYSVTPNPAAPSASTPSSKATCVTAVRASTQPTSSPTRRAATWLLKVTRFRFRTVVVAADWRLSRTWCSQRIRYVPDFLSLSCAQNWLCIRLFLFMRK